jgi:signal transduction histidine kinase
VKVVLADDTPDIRALLRLVLSRHDDFEVVGEAGDGAEAVALAGQLQPDVILLDLAMPVMDGLEAIPLVRAAAPGCTIIVLTGFNAGRMAAEAERAGANAYLEKGVSPAVLVDEIRRITGAGTAVSSGGPTAQEHERATASMAAAVLPAATVADLSMVTHELMGPLTIIEGFAALLERRADRLDPEDVREHAARIGRSAAHLRDLLNAMADARRIDVQGLSVHPEEVDVAELLPPIVDDLATVTAANPVRVTADGPLHAAVDAMRLRQMITNLVSNAAKFSPPGAPIDIVARRRAGGDVEILVSDQGPGIPVERRRELFQPFSRLGVSVKGMGLGLYISRGIARAHGGDLQLVPTEMGSTFVVVLPGRDTSAGAGPAGG